jgi:Beta-lactamase.
MSETSAARKIFKSASLVAVMLLLAALAFIALAYGIFDSPYEGAPKSDGPAGASLAGLITELRKEKKLVGLAAMVMVDGKVMASAAHGERKKGSGVPIELGDRWHLGSITKSDHGDNDRATGRVGSNEVDGHRRRALS